MAKAKTAFAMKLLNVIEGSRLFLEDSKVDNLWANHNHQEQDTGNQCPDEYDGWRRVILFN